MSAQNSVVVQIARPYASALFDLARDADSVSAVETSLDSFVTLVDASDDFSSFLQSPLISADVKSSAVDAIVAKAKAPELVANFVRMVARNERLFALTTIIAAFKDLAAKERGEVSADVTSAAPLSKEQLKSLADTLKKKIGKTVTLNTHVDSDLIGGLLVKVGSQMIDSSLRTKLSAMKIAMKEVG